MLLRSNIHTQSERSSFYHAMFKRFFTLSDLTRRKRIDFKMLIEAILDLALITGSLSAPGLLASFAL
jgi:hypothetical protein